jgi:hypothetical protein
MVDEDELDKDYDQRMMKTVMKMKMMKALMKIKTKVVRFLLQLVIFDGV